MLFWSKGPDLKRRATDLEMIDEPAQIPRKEMEQVFRELALVNRWLGGTSACLRAIVPFLSTGLKREPVLIADVGAGSGDILCALAARSLNRHNDLHMLAIDVNPEVCRLASKQAKVWPEISVVCADVENLSFVKNRFDIVLCSAFLHHFCDHKLVKIINCLRECTTRAIIINDLHRHPVAYWSIRFLCRLFSRSKAVRNDGPLSVQKGFTRKELVNLLESAGCCDFCISWRWAFRWVVTIRK